MIWLIPDTRAYNLISILCVAGEYPAQSIDLMSSRRMMRRTIHDMSQKETYRMDDGDFTYDTPKGCCVQKVTATMLHLYGSKSKGSIRFAKSGRIAVAQLFPDEYKYFETLNYIDAVYGSYYNDSGHIERNHRVAESTAMMLAAGVEYRIPYMPDIEDWMREDGPCYYVAKFTKTAMDCKIDKYSGSRMTGLLLTDSTAYTVYNTRNTIMKWDGATEQKMQVNLSSLLGGCRDNLSTKSAIVFGDNEILAPFLTALHCWRPEKKSICTIYRNVHFVPMNEFGISLLTMLTLPDWHDRLLDIVFKPGERNAYPDAFGQDFDGERNGKKVVCLFDGNISRILRIREQNALTGERPIILCCTEQMPNIKSFFGPEADVRAIPMSSIREELKF